jgi:hypothetical protein
MEQPMIDRIFNAIASIIIMACLLSVIVWCVAGVAATSDVQAACQKQTTLAYKTCIHEATK